MPKFRPARGKKKSETTSRARQVGCIFWLIMAMALVMWLFYAILKG